MNEHVEYLRFLVHRGAVERYSDESIPKRWDAFTTSDHPVCQRVMEELGVIEEAGYSTYFLIMYDLIDFCRSKNIPVGPGRGSVGGCIVAFLLYIHDLDPIRFDLPFERFLHLERVQMPDIDLDVCQQKRSQVIGYLRDQYGLEKEKDTLADTAVGQIIAFGTMMAKGATKIVLRVSGYDEQHGFPYNTTGPRLSDLIPEGSGTDQIVLSEWLETEEGAGAKHEFQTLAPIKFWSESQPIRVLEDLILPLEGLVHHATTHAAGIVVSDGPLRERVPLWVRSRKDLEEDPPKIYVAFDYIDAEDAGLLKLDVLGLRTVSVIAEAEDRIREWKKDPEWSIKDEPLDDQKAFQILRDGDTVGVFQLEDHGITRATEAVAPDRFDDIVHVIALYRPGPMEYIPQYVDRKFGREEPSYYHPDLEEVLEPTHGLIVFQEQVMKIAQIMGGYTPGEADLFRKAIGKKLPKLMKKEIGKWKKRALENGYPVDAVEQIASDMFAFARYSFNKSHGTAYAHLTYWTAWIKAHYPSIFYQALLNGWLGNADRTATILSDAADNDIRILPPDINESGKNFRAIDEKTVRFGLAAVKLVGDTAVDNIIAVRDKDERIEYEYIPTERTKDDGTKYTAHIKTPQPVTNEPRDFDGPVDFCARLPSLAVNVKESLVAAGAFTDKMEERVKLYCCMRELNPAAKAGKTFDWREWDGDITLSHAEMIELEREALGFYITEHPIDRHRAALKRYGARVSGEWDDLPTHLVIGGIVEKINGINSVRGPMAKIHVQNAIVGMPVVTIFSDTYAKCGSALEKGQPVVIAGKKENHERYGVQMIASDVFVLKNGQPAGDRVLLCLEGASAFDAMLLQRHEGVVERANGRSCAVLELVVEDAGRFVHVRTGRKLVMEEHVLRSVEDCWPVWIESSPRWVDGKKLRRVESWKGSGTERKAAWELPVVSEILGALDGRVSAEYEVIE